MVLVVWALEDDLCRDDAEWVYSAGEEVLGERRQWKMEPEKEKSSRQ